MHFFFHFFALFTLSHFLHFLHFFAFFCTCFHCPVTVVFAFLMSVTQPEAGAQAHTNDEEEENEPDLLESDSDDDEPKAKKSKTSAFLQVETQRNPWQANHPGDTPPLIFRIFELLDKRLKSVSLKLVFICEHTQPLSQALNALQGRQALRNN